MADPRAHGGAFIPAGSEAGRSQRTQAPPVYGAPRVQGADSRATGQARNVGPPGMAHGGGYVPNPQPPRRKYVQETPEPPREADSGYVPTGHRKAPGPGQGQAYQPLPYQAQEYQTQAYQAQPYQSQPYQSQSYQSQPYQSQSYQSQPYQPQPYQSEAYQSQVYQAQGSYATSSHTEATADSYTAGTSTQAFFNSQPSDPASAQQGSPLGRTRRSDQAKSAAVAILRLAEPTGISDTVPMFDQSQRTKQKGFSNRYHPRSSWRFKYPQSFQMPQLLFRATDNRRHRDIMQRVFQGLEEDRYISPSNGHLAKLVVQATQDVYDGAPNATWRRTYVRNVSPPYIHVANWPFASLPTKSEHWTGNDWAVLCTKWLPACAGLLFVLLLNPNAQNGKLRNDGCYDPFLYKHWGYPKTARNVLENSPSATKQAGELTATRALGPRFLCFLNQRNTGVTVTATDETTADTEYIFIGYSTKQFDNNSEEDMNALHQMAEKAAREAGVPAFWVAGSCMPDKAEMEQDVYRISDVMRGAHSLVIVVGPEPSSTALQTREALLKSWGMRMWTLPEVLLSPSHEKIKVYTRGHDGPPWEIAKKNFAAVVWNDPLVSRQLVDHYGKNLDLSRLELINVGLKCLGSRERGEYFEGDLSYALMGLLRQRPTVDSTDSAFLAFARLSMANDSDRLLERLICTLPKDYRASWLSMTDAWDSNLWDIYPTCQVAGIGPGDTVILDGAFAASIRWKAFAPVFYTRQDTWKRLGIRVILHGAPIFFLMGIALASIGGGLKGIGIFILIIALFVLLASPYLTRVTYGGKLWGTQAGFQGFEGYMDLATIESHIFGAYMGRLKWSTAGSPLSCHQMNEFEECVGLDPMLREEVRDLVDNANNGGHDSLKVFTLVDTYTMTVTMFAAVRPPVAVVLCGHEGGMQRAVLCSYDWGAQTLYRETVLRMETPVIGRMDRVNRFRFGLHRPVSDVQQATGPNTT